MAEECIVSPIAALESDAARLLTSLSSSSIGVRGDEHLQSVQEISCVNIILRDVYEKCSFTR
jgi:hypothetical protein